MKKIKLLIIACFLMTNLYAEQDFQLVSGMNLLDGIRVSLRLAEGEVLSPVETLKATKAASYVKGYSDALIITQAAQGLKFTDLGNGNYTLEQQMRVIKAYLEKRPKDLHKSPRVIVFAALVKAFPSKQ
jgi:hypothetical protein